MSQPRSSDEAAADHLVSMLGDLRHKIHLVESKQLQAEAALEGCGHYLGTEGHVRNPPYKTPNAFDAAVLPRLSDHTRVLCASQDLDRQARLLCCFVARWVLGTWTLGGEHKTITILKMHGMIVKVL